MRKKNIDEVLHDGASEKGRAKVRALISPGQRWVCPSNSGTYRLDGTGIGHRISWELIQHLIKTSKEALVADMRSARVGKASAKQYEQSCEVTTLELGVIALQMMLPRDLSDYDATNGFDLDLFLHVEDLESSNGFYMIEVFPRESVGVHSTAFASDLSYRVPFAVLDSKEDRDTLTQIVFNEQLLLGADQAKLHEEWRTWQGPWRLMENRFIEIFLSRGLMSFLIALGLDTRWSGPTLDVEVGTGVVHKASLMRHLSVN